MKLTVTPFDLDRGEPESSTQCPIALALKRAFPGSARVIVDLDIIVDFSSCSRLTTKVPPEARQFIRKFDNAITDNDLPSPITFDLDLK